MPALLCPTCPLCSGPPDEFLLALTRGEQAFCVNDGCDVLAWSPAQSLDDNLTNARPVRIERRVTSRAAKDAR